MVFYYTIRGGPCRNGHSHIVLDGERDIICYVGRDKHENEHLIKYGWPGDVWFHVEGLSSAHVYFRIRNIHSHPSVPIDGIPMDDLPSDAIYDMMQICKHNSIQGCKLASCKMVYTPHSNLKKTFEMESGAVTYHDTKLCRYGRCDKDRARIRELEKTKSQDIKVDFYEEFQTHKRNMIERKKRERQQGGGGGRGGGIAQMYDPVLDDLRSTKHKSKRQGDEVSGIDAALAGLDYVATASAAVMTSNARSNDNERNDGTSNNAKSTAASSSSLPSSPDPIWIQEDRQRKIECANKGDLIFLCERGYAVTEAREALREVPPSAKNQLPAALKALFFSLPDGAEDAGAAMAAAADVEVTKEEILATRCEEREVLQAIFGTDDDDEENSGVRFAVVGDDDGSSSLDSTLLITSYEPPARYGLSPPLVMEVYVDGVTDYPRGPPVLALKGGGLPWSTLRRLTALARNEALRRSAEEPGDPQIFNLLTAVGEQADALVGEEGVQYEKEMRERRRKAAQEARERAAQEARKRATEGNEKDGGGPAQAAFASERERRAYARSVLAGGRGSGGASKTGSELPRQNQRYDAGVSDAKLFDEMFGF